MKKNVKRFEAFTTEELITLHQALSLLQGEPNYDKLRNQITETLEHRKVSADKLLSPDIGFRAYWIEILEEDLSD